MRSASLVERHGRDTYINVGHGVRLIETKLVWDEGVTWRWEHVCKIDTDGEKHPVVANFLDDRHTVTRNYGNSVTVRPALECKACGLHGYITQGLWYSYDA